MREPPFSGFSGLAYYVPGNCQSQGRPKAVVFIYLRHNTMDETPQFIGFDTPQQNWSKLPHQFVNLLNVIDSIAELKVTLYILRHTWGFSEYELPVHLTTDEIA